MTLNKYNEYMSHIEVTDEMKARVLANVSKAIEEQKADGGAKADVTPMPVARKKKPVPIAAIISIAASVLIVGGIVVLFISNNPDIPKTAKSDKVSTEAAETEAADGAADIVSKTFTDGDSAPEYYAGGDGFIDEAADEAAVDLDSDSEETTTSQGKDPGEGVEETAGADIYALMPTDYSMVAQSEENGVQIYTFNNDGNNCVIYMADEGVDLPEMYKDDVLDENTIILNGTTDNGGNYALFNNMPDAGAVYNAASFANNGKTYLIVFDKPVPEESLREFISEY